MVLSFNCGGGVGQITSAKTYNDGEWHLVDVQRTGKDASLTMDMDDSTSKPAFFWDCEVLPEIFLSSALKTTSPGSHMDLDVADVYYVGGTKTPHRHRYELALFHLSEDV